MPFSLATTIYGVINFKFDFSESLKLGTPVFRSSIIKFNGNDQINAAARDNIILLKPGSTIESKTHELLHTYQYEQLSGLNVYLDKPSNKLGQNFKPYKFYRKYFYTDWNSLVYDIIYEINPKFENNYFEKEAEFFDN